MARSTGSRSPSRFRTGRSRLRSRPLRPREPLPESPALSVSGLRKAYGDLLVLQGLDLEVTTGEVVAVTGPSASGKTTLLRTITGEEAIDAGRIAVAGRVLADDRTDLAPDKRPVAAVPQGGGLLDDRNAGANIALALPRRVRNSRAGAQRVATVFDLVGLPEGTADRRPPQLSVGEKQRVALARALVVEPAVLLLDEPFYAFDPGTTAAFRADLRRVLRETATATVLVTHDDHDVTELADRQLRLVGGRLVEPGR